MCKKAYFPGVYTQSGISLALSFCSWIRTWMQRSHIFVMHGELMLCVLYGGELMRTPRRQQMMTAEFIFCRLSLMNGKYLIYQVQCQSPDQRNGAAIKNPGIYRSQSLGVPKDISRKASFQSAENI